MRREFSRCASEISSGAPVAQTAAKSLKSFAPVEKSSGAFGIIEGVFRHKKTPENGGCSESAPLDLLNFLRKLSSSGALVNTRLTGASK